MHQLSKVTYRLKKVGIGMWRYFVVYRRQVSTRTTRDSYGYQDDGKLEHGKVEHHGNAMPSMP